MKQHYIYIREDPIYRASLPIIKLGQTTGPIERDESYATGEPIRGKFIQLYEILNMTCLQAEKILQDEFIEYHHNGNGGIEFYNDKICQLMEQTFQKKNIEYVSVNFEEMVRQMREREKLITPPESSIRDKIVLREYQCEIKNKLIKYYKTNDKAILHWICGLGKTIFSIDIINHYQFNRVIIGVPSTILMYQWEEELTKYTNHKIYLNGDNHLFEVRELQEPYIIVSTFSSSYKLKGLSFDFRIIDEMHHIVYDDTINEEESKRHKEILNIPTKKQLGLSATMKKSDKEHIISAAYAGVLKLRSMGSPSCELFLREDTKSDYEEFQINHISPEVIVIGDLGDQWTFDIMNNILKKKSYLHNLQFSEYTIASYSLRVIYCAC